MLNGIARIMGKSVKMFFWVKPKFDRGTTNNSVNLQWILLQIGALFAHDKLLVMSKFQKDSCNAAQTRRIRAT